ncbi:bacillithiol system redox-active protein YtxJ [Cytobacillus sp. FJAT-54145]|uniref:Bacillithiol system redox-active protein YtxJ n=1 Tax=Cytobacillus spartinae TaxID=3299023 RepID=A0ABW6KKY2_9BACI
MKKIDSVEQFDQAVNEGETIFILKHSLTCPISHAAYEEYEKFASEHLQNHTYYLAVQEARPLSNHIAETFHIKHESPQAILFMNGDVVWHASHWKITFESLEKALQENQQ